MKKEYANASSRTGITPPSKAEMALVRSRGKDSITGAELAAMRSDAKNARRPSITTKTPTLAKAATITKTAVKPTTTATDAQTIRKLTGKINRLEQEITGLKLRILKNSL